MKLLTSTIAILALSVSVAAARDNNNGPKGGDATAIAGAAQAQGQIQGQAQGQSQNTSVNVETPKFTYGIFGQIGSSNNSPCGRVFLGIPASGENCTARMEAQALYNAVLPAYGEKKAAQAAMHHLCANDRTMRNTLVAIGVCQVK